MSVLVGNPAPDFTATAVLGDNSLNGNFKLSDYKGKKYVVLFFYPLDFTFVCPTELIAFDHRLKEFHDRNCEVVGVSVDSQFCHLAWKNTAPDKGGIGKVGYPLVADLTHDIAKAYDVHNGAVAYRGTFLIDKNGIVQHQAVNNLALGRNVDETLRMVDALQFHETHGEVCPAGWNKGKKAMTASADGVAAFLADNAKGL